MNENELKDLEIIATSTNAEEINDALSRHEGDRDFMYEAGTILDGRDDVVDINEAVRMIDEKNVGIIEDAYPDVELKPSSETDVAYGNLDGVTEIKSSDDSEYGVGEFYIKDDIESLDTGDASDLLAEYVNKNQFNREFEDFNMPPVDEIASEFQKAMDDKGMTTASVEGSLYVEGATETENTIFLQTQNSNDTITVIPVDNFENFASELSDSQLKAIAEMTDNSEVLDVLSKVDNEEVKEAVRENLNTSEETLENMDKAAMLKNDFQALSVNDQIDIKTDGQFNNDQDKQTNSGGMRM